MHDETSLQKRECSQAPTPDILYGSIDAAKVRVEPRDPQEKAAKNRETWRDLKAGCWSRAAWMSGDWHKLVAARSRLPLAA